MRPVATIVVVVALLAAAGACKKNEDASRVDPAIVIVILAIMPGVAILKSCTALPGQTREEFSQVYSCPMDSITSKARDDVQSAEFAPTPTLPADVAADPARLAPRTSSTTTRTPAPSRA